MYERYAFQTRNFKGIKRTFQNFWTNAIHSTIYLILNKRAYFEFFTNTSFQNIFFYCVIAVILIYTDE